MKKAKTTKKAEETTDVSGAITTGSNPIAVSVNTRRGYRKIILRSIVLIILLAIAGFVTYKLTAEPAAPKTLLELSERDARTAKNDTEKLSAYYSQANVLKSNNQYKKAIEVYEKANELKPDDPTILGNIADMHFMLKNKEQAIEYYNRAISRAEKDKSTYGDNIEIWNAAIKLAKNNTFSFEDATGE